jgi:PhzF family phenazine biosynthesis protein
MDKIRSEVLRYAAFTDSGMGGNPAGVVLDARSLSDADMLAIAQEVGYSETSFVLPTLNPAAFRVRYFSPVSEVAFCGHATVAAAVALAERDGPGELDFTTLAGRITVNAIAAEHGVTATLTSPATRTRPVTEPVLSAALAAIGWELDDLDPTYPPHVAFAGNNHLMLGVSRLATLAGLDYDFHQLSELMQQEQWTTVHMFWAEDDGVFHVRNAFPPGGVVEDPATGAAAAAFGGYLRTLDLVTMPARLILLQGRHMGSPSRLIVDVDADADTVRVTGSAFRMPVPPSDAHENGAN